MTPTVSGIICLYTFFVSLVFSPDFLPLENLLQQF
jgi:hypothetical protein